MAERGPTDDPEDKELTSPSPDSGISLCDEEERPRAEEREAARRQPAPCRNTLNPFFFRYQDPDNRKLTLLKSLSQDSEYSLDGSLFDAEEFLQDLGFAGTVDPTIPERFLPSLMQRLSKFPESEIGTLHERIVQSIGCFRRKEGKRRLFRNLSMGKDAFSENIVTNNLLPSANNYPLIRSNTGPAAFTYEEEPAKQNAGSRLRIDTGPPSEVPFVSSVSQDDESKLPLSPVAILVSQASIECTESENALGDHHQLLVDQKLNDEDAADSVSDSRAPLEASEVQIQNSFEHAASKCSDLTSSTEETSCTDSCIQNESGALSKEGGEFPNEVRAKHSSNLSIEEKNALNDLLDKKIIKNNHIEPDKSYIGHRRNTLDNVDIFSFTKDDGILPKTAQLFKGMKSFRPKAPLRRTSTPQTSDSIYELTNNLRNSISAEPLTLPTDEKSDTFCIGNEESLEKNIETLKKTDYQNISTKTQSSEEGEFPSQKVPRFLQKSMKSRSEVSLSNKLPPVDKTYSRSNSFSNFLSSMLSVEEESVTNSTFEENSFFDDSNSELADSSLLSFTATGFTPHSEQMSAVVTPVEELAAKTSLQKPVNQLLHDSAIESSEECDKVLETRAGDSKCRLLRRMSSSLECLHSSGDAEELKTASDVEEPKSYVAHPYSLLPVHSSQGKKRIKKVLSAPGSTPEQNYIFESRIKYFDFSSFPEIIYRENMEVENKNCDFIVNNSLNTCTCKNVRQLKRKRHNSCPSTKLNFSSIPDLNFRCSVSNDCRCALHYNLCLSHRHPSNCAFDCNVPRHLFHSCIPDTKHVSSNLHLPRPSRSSSDVDNDSRQRGSPPLVASPYRTNDFFPSRTKFAGCENSSPQSAESFSFRKRKLCKHSRTNFAPDSDEVTVKNLSNQKPFRGRLHRLECISDSHVMFIDDSFSQDDEVFTPRATVACCCKGLSCSCALEHRCLASDKNQKSSKSDVAAPAPTEVFLHNDVTLEDVGMSEGYDKESVTDGEMKQDSNTCTEELMMDCSNPKVISVSKSLPLVENGEKPDMLSFKLSNGIDDSKTRHSELKDENITPLLAQNKREAMLEKKIHLFSKFLTNLTKLSATSTNFTPNKNSKQRRCDDAFGPPLHACDKIEQNNQPRKCFTPTADIDKFLYLLKAVELKKKSAIGSDEMRASENEASPGTSERPVYRNGVLIRVNDSIELLSKPVYSSAVHLDVNSEATRQSETQRGDGGSRDNKSSQEKNKSLRCSIPFQGVSKDLEELQTSIQKAKETRISASRELQFLQELLSGETDDEYHRALSKQWRSTSQWNSGMPRSFSSDNLCIGKEKQEKAIASQALSNLRQNSKRQVLEDSEFWQQELEKMRKENEQMWRERLDRMEEKLRSQEEELMRVQGENEDMQRRLDERSTPCPCRSDPNTNGGFLRIDSAFEDDEEFFNYKSSTPTLSMKQETERLQEKLNLSEQKADELNLLLNQKSIELSKLQITYSKQTKEIIELEKAYIQLQCRFRKNASKPIVSRLCTKTSPFSPKNLFPKPSPPATPMPTSICP